jgi:hypothetical protein
VQSPSDSQRAGLKDLYAALTVVALEPLKLSTAALPKGLLSPAEFCILKLLGYNAWEAFILPLNYTRMRLKVQAL